MKTVGAQPEQPCSAVTLNGHWSESLSSSSLTFSLLNQNSRGGCIGKICVCL